MSKPFTSVEHAIRWSEQHNHPALLVTDNLSTILADAKGLGYEVDYSELDKDLNDDRETYDVWGMDTENPDSGDMSWRLTVKVEPQD